jgi:glycosyltransferase involved in cell wall biosynthesis
MRVLMLIERYLPIWGGAEIQLSQLASQLAQKGYGITILTRRWRSDLRRNEQSAAGIEIIRVGIPGGGTMAQVAYILSVILFMLLNRRAYQLFHSHGAIKMGALACFMGRWLNVKTLSKIATAGHGPNLSRTFLGRRLISHFRKVDAVITMTTEIEREMRALGIDPDRMAGIPNGIDCQRFNRPADRDRKRLRVKLGVTENTLVILFSGRLVYRKGLDLLLDAWADISAGCPSALLMVMGSGKGQPESVEKILKNRVRNSDFTNVRFVGETDRPEEILGMADMFVLPSRQEGFPNTLLEAMACRLPVVASSIGGVVDVVVDRQNGLLFKYQDSQDLKDKILFLCQSPLKRESLGAMARETVCREYSFDSISAEYAELYTRLTGA